jgi:uncharacterized membrane protein YbhN (UPF0104 family)
MKKSKIIGILFMLISFGFILREILKMDISSLQIAHPVRAIVLILIFTVLTIGSVVLAAIAWRNILSAIHGDKIVFAEVFKVYVKANVAKYLPGNVLHYAGRNVIGSRLGWKHSDILLSSILEVLMILISAAIFLLLFAYRQFVSVVAGAVRNAATNPLILILLAAVLGIGTAGTIFLLYKRRDLIEKLKLLFTAKFLKVLVINFFLYTGTFLIQGIVMAFIFSSVFQAGSMGIDKVLLVISSAVLSWFAGFITPGAPGGLGVKEAVLILMLSPVYGREYTLAAALVHRLISVIADAAAFGIGFAMERRDKMI